MADPKKGPPDHKPKSTKTAEGEKPAIITYVKPEMELYIASGKYTGPEQKGHVAQTTCKCDLVCTCQSVALCGCNLVYVRNPIAVTSICVCNTVPVCTCNTVLRCACNMVCERICTCDLVCTCNPQCACQRVGGGGGGGSVCVCVPVIH